ncbi:hypothetical protein BCR36DRAFT_371314 [Piromyces finnis]|uniref:Uncharacterized protein n=1 Tax=Piromyces finnis TaxID=1754191 RepID=A0A1Y1V6R4_9FUNG|nr:hypothetical protein BCR36DRAFT_371314 [Piromyces finnis]|eukprot:ORX48462.1 hypothetical protein BCR36DRAFT_371314 [Piromyces finnis]
MKITNIESAESTKNIEDIEFIKGIEFTDSIVFTEGTESTEFTEGIENTENIEDIENVESISIMMTCTISYNDEIQDTISISSENGQFYHKSAGKTIIKGDTYTEEQNRPIELAHSLVVVSDSTNGNTTKGFSKSFENTHNISEKAHTYTFNEDYSHAVTDGRDVANETNWSKSEEISKTKI